MELRLSLAEVADALAEVSWGRADLREILRELRDDLARQQRGIAGCRAAIEELLDRPEDLTRSADHHRALARLRDAWPPGHAGLAREEEVSDLLEAAVGAGRTTGMWQAYELTLADPAVTAQTQELSERFEALAGLDSDDAAVDVLADSKGLGDLKGAVLGAVYQWRRLRH